MKILIFLTFAFILYSLGAALFYMMRDGQQSTRMLKALSIRVALSLLLFSALMLSFAMEWIQPGRL